jgi:hypothetical protein
MFLWGNQAIFWRHGVDVRQAETDAAGNLNFAPKPARMIEIKLKKCYPYLI